MIFLALAAGCRMCEVLLQVLFLGRIHRPLRFPVTSGGCSVFHKLPTFAEITDRYLRSNLFHLLLRTTEKSVGSGYFIGDSQGIN